MNKGFLCQNSDSNKAMGHFLQALNITGKPEARLLANLGAACYNLGKCHQAILYYEHALAIYNGDKTNAFGPTINGQLAACYTHVGEYSRAEQLFDKILPHLKSVDNGLVYGQQLYNRGILSMYTKCYDEAIDFFEQTLVYTKNNQQIYVSALIGKINALIKLKRLTECKKIIDTTRSLAEECEKLTVMLTASIHQMNLNNPSATAYLEDEAIPFLRASGGISKFTAINILKDLEAHYLKKKSKQKALNMSHTIREIYEELFYGAG